MADTDLSAPLTPSPPDIMNGSAFTPVPQRRNTASTTVSDQTSTCRICRSEGTPEEPLFYPCKCSGSIKYVHQECLMEWLSHSHKKHCELCKTPFRFTKLYDADMPGQLPWSVFLRRAMIHVVWTFGRGCRSVLVGGVWLVILPWLIRWAWRWMFWVADAGWARKAFLNNLATEARIDSVIHKVNDTSYTVSGLMQELGDKTMDMTFNRTGPEAYKVARDVVSTLFQQHGWSAAPAPDDSLPGASLEAADSSILSSWTYISELTPSPRLNRIILDIFEGQLITCVVITGFILVFLIREWVVQQQPLVNLDNLNNVQQQLREAADRVEADNARLRRQQELLEQARRRLVELQDQTNDIGDPLDEGQGSSAPEASTQDFGGWDTLETLIDHATAHLRNDGTAVGEHGGEGQDERQRFKFCAQAVLKQIRAAGQTPGQEMDDLAARIAEKLGTLSPDERAQWEGVLLSEVERARSGRAGVRQRAQSDPTRFPLSLSPSEVPQSIGDTDAEGSSGTTRPRMPDRDFSSRATQIQRLLEEAEGIFNPQERERARAAAYAMAQQRRDSEAAVAAGASDANAASIQVNALVVNNVMGSGSWRQHVDGSLEPLDRRRSDGQAQIGLEMDEMPITNAGPDAKVNIRRSGKGKARVVPEPKEVTSEEVKRRQEEDEAMKKLEEEIKAEDAVGATSTTQAGRPAPANEEQHQQSGQPQMNSNPFHPEGPEPDRPRTGDVPVMAATLNAEETEALQRAEFGPEAEAAQEDDQEDEEQPPQRPAAPPSHFQQLADWFWGDIQVQDVPEPALVPNEERAEGEQAAPFVPVVDGQPALPAANVEAEHIHDHQQEHHDPEVVAAAQAAGLDAEAIEDAEDLEGIFELIGLQGPLIGLFQTSTFCTVLVTGTVFGAVGLPYMWGKLMLSLIGSPMYFLVKLPLQFASFVADVVVDITLLLGGWAVFVAALASDFLLSALELWVPKLGGVRVAEWIADFATATASKSGGRLQSLFLTTEPIEQEIAGWNWAFLGASVHAHASLREVQGEVSAVMTWLGQGVTDVVETISSGSTAVVWDRTLDALSHITELPAWLRVGVEVLGQYTQPLFQSLNLLRTGSLSFDTPTIPISDPTLIYWSTTDRTLAVCAGYGSLALLAAIYVALDTPITRPDSAGRKTETLVRDTLRQAGGVLKVILIISIEMLVFPFYCGLLLDLAFLPLFSGASVASRWAWAGRIPWTFCFVHWFVGTCYMFHFALFVGMCRKILRKGVLWFIRDPDDPTFHPVRDVLERNVMTQLRKIAFSALVYGALVILCLGGVIWTIGKVCEGIFPIHWVSTEPVLEFPMDLLLYNAVTPLVIRLFKPSEAVHVMYAWWLRRCARVLRLSHFLFDDRRKEEEGRHVRKSWASFLLMRKASVEQEEDVSEAKRITESGETPEVVFHRDGKYVLTPCNDQYRPPKPGEAFLHADDEDVYIADKDGKKNDHFAKVYVPPAFRLRVTLFMVCLWMFSAFTGLCATLVPLVFGRQLFASLLPEGMRVNDIYAYSVGAYIIGGLLYALLQGRPAIQYLREKVPAVDVRAWTQSAKRYSIQGLKCAYVYGFVALVLPTMFALLLQFYFILPLHTYVVSVASAATSSQQEVSALSKAINATNMVRDAGLFNYTLPAPQTHSQLPTLAAHTIHILQDYCLGLLYVRLATRFIIGTPASRAAEAFRRVTADGYFNPDARLATRFLIAPATLISAFILVCPPVLAKLAISAATLHSGRILTQLDQEAVVKIYRYSYPVTAALIVIAVCASEIGQATARWRARIRDEVYLVGERLHNFGEKKPPVGSRSVVRREK